MTRAQLTAMVIFLKEAFVQIDNARKIAVEAKDQPTAQDIAALQRDVKPASSPTSRRFDQ